MFILYITHILLTFLIIDKNIQLVVLRASLFVSDTYSMLFPC